MSDKLHTNNRYRENQQQQQNNHQLMKRLLVCLVQTMLLMSECVLKSWLVKSRWSSVSCLPFNPFDHFDLNFVIKAKFMK